MNNNKYYITISCIPCNMAYINNL